MLLHYISFSIYKLHLFTVVTFQVRRGLVNMATTAGKLTDVNVRKAYFTFMSKLKSNEKLTVDTFVMKLLSELPVDWADAGFPENSGNQEISTVLSSTETTETTAAAPAESESAPAEAEAKSEEEAAAESESSAAEGAAGEQSVPNGDVEKAKALERKKALKKALPLRIKLRMLMDHHHIWNTVSCADIAKLMKGDVVQELENKLRYMLMRKALATDGMSHWLIDIALSLDRTKIKIYARDPESSTVMKLGKYIQNERCSAKCSL